ncbi:MAG TPA: Maf family protein [Turneriella sp.]|nr:Maf family protein [Turneriella sp.]HMY10004.1 Maf family protein [Turneriella sp.]HNA78134.1 Maf family protein [Turneriella sp.]HNE18240.1 Maf family protein [Turneriella sp.]HNJ66875.1 Maf family protein [Turneriella sp.]
MFSALTKTPLLLASSSPRRREILERLGFTCEIRPAGIDEESIRHADAAEQTLLLAEKKADVVALPGRLTVAADTVVVLDGEVIEKPRDKGHARSMLQSLSGRDHIVYTAVAVVFPKGERLRFIEETRVFFDALSTETIESYIASPQPYDKAGGYGAQDAFGMACIRRFEGCYFNVMGFPASRFMRVLSENRKFLQG